VSRKEALLTFVSFVIADIQLGGLTISQTIPTLFEIMFRFLGIVSDKIENLHIVKTAQLSEVGTGTYPVMRFLLFSIAFVDHSDDPSLFIR
jgi:hypothetical protein